MSLGCSPGGLSSPAEAAETRWACGGSSYNSREESVRPSSANPSLPLAVRFSEMKIPCRQPFALSPEK